MIAIIIATANIVMVIPFTENSKKTTKIRRDAKHMKGGHMNNARITQLLGTELL